MKRITNFSLSLLIFAFCIQKSFQSYRHTNEHDHNTLINKNPTNTIKKYGLLDGLNMLEDENEFKKLLELSLKYGKREKRTITNDLLSDSPEDPDDLLIQSQQGFDRTDLDLLPPFVILWLKQKQSKYLEEKEKYDQDKQKIFRPILGRDLDDDDCQRSRPPFAPRLGKKSLPFKPRLGRNIYEDVKC